MNKSVAQNSAVSFAQSMVIKADIKPIRIKVKLESNASIKSRIDANRESIILALESNKTAKDMAERHNVTVVTIYAAMRRWGYSRNISDTTTSSLGWLVKNIYKGIANETVTVTVRGKIVGTFTPLENNNDNN